MPDIFAGNILKRGESGIFSAGSWKLRYLVLRSNAFEYYESEEDFTVKHKQPIKGNVIPLSHLAISLDLGSTGDASATSVDAFYLIPEVSAVGSGRIWEFKAVMTGPSRDDWIREFTARGVSSKYPIGISIGSSAKSESPESANTKSGEKNDDPVNVVSITPKATEKLPVLAAIPAPATPVMLGIATPSTLPSRPQSKAGSVVASPSGSPKLLAAPATIAVQSGFLKLEISIRTSPDQVVEYCYPKRWVVVRDGTMKWFTMKDERNKEGAPQDVLQSICLEAITSRVFYPSRFCLTAVQKDHCTITITGLYMSKTTPEDREKWRMALGSILDEEKLEEERPADPLPLADEPAHAAPKGAYVPEWQAAPSPSLGKSGGRAQSRHNEKYPV